jgi:hypothetical protein
MKNLWHALTHHPLFPYGLAIVLVVLGELWIAFRNWF